MHLSLWSVEIKSNSVHNLLQFSEFSCSSCSNSPPDFLDGPRIMVPVDLKASFGNTTDTQHTLTYSKSVPTCSTPTMHPSPSQTHCAWFRINFDLKRNNDPGIASDIEETWLYLREILKDHRFDVGQEFINLTLMTNKQSVGYIWL